MRAVYVLTLRQMSGKWRLIILTLLAALPVISAVLTLSDDKAPPVAAFEKAVLSAILAGAIAPLVVLAIAGAAFSNEVEDRTLANLVLTPLPRWKIVVPKLLASLTIAGPFIAVSAFATSHVAFLADWRATIAVTVSALVGVALYTAAFIWLGLLTTQAIGLGLLYIVLWEGLFSGFVAGVRLLSVRYYAVAIMHGIDPRRFAGSKHPSFAVAIIVCSAAFALLMFLSVRRLRRMDIP